MPTNRIGQNIEKGDQVIYFTATWHEERGTFLGLTPKGCVRIQHATGKQRAVKNDRSGQIYGYYNRRVWKRKPGEYYIHKETGLLIDQDDYHKLDYKDRYENYRWDSDGKLELGYSIIEVPYVYIGQLGIRRTFRVVDEEVHI